MKWLPRNADYNKQTNNHHKTKPPNQPINQPTHTHACIVSNQTSPQGSTVGENYFPRKITDEYFYWLFLPISHSWDPTETLDPGEKCSTAREPRPSHFPLPILDRLRQSSPQIRTGLSSIETAFQATKKKATTRKWHSFAEGNQEISKTAQTKSIEQDNRVKEKMWYEKGNKRCTKPKITLCKDAQGRMVRCGTRWAQSWRLSVYRKALSNWFEWPKAA